MQMTSFNTTDPITLFFSILVFLVIISLVISVHEAAHAFVANLRGDPTARLMGRMTLNPIAHIDPLGTLIIPLFLLIFSGFMFGWAKPTPINPLNFRYPRRDSALTALAGPASNFLLAVIFAITFRLFPNSISLFLVQINLILGIFNLIPVPPLDGFKIIIGILPKELAISLSGLEAYGPFLMLGLLFVFLWVFSPAIVAAVHFLTVILTG